jgi:hypothetical protein
MSITARPTVITVPLDSAEGVAARVPEVRAGDVTHVHVTGIRSRMVATDYERMEPVYAAGRAALAARGLDEMEWADWTNTEHYGFGVCWQWIHLHDGHRIALTWVD